MFGTYVTNTTTILRLRLHGDYVNRRRKSGVASSLIISRLDERSHEEICVHTVTQKCVEIHWVCAAMCNAHV